jgi:membrane associated rhomboid family serine protease
MVLLGLCVKVALEQPFVRFFLGWDVAALPLMGAPGWVVAGSAHFAGVVAGLACAALVDAAAHLLRRFSPAARAGTAANH